MFYFIFIFLASLRFIFIYETTFIKYKICTGRKKIVFFSRLETCYCNKYIFIKFVYVYLFIAFSLLFDTSKED